MKKPLLLFCSALLLFSTLQAQKIAPADLKKLRKSEDSLKALSRKLIVDSLTASRMRSDSLFIRTLVRTLQIKNSFYYPFDSIRGIAKVYAPDSTFRIFSWTLSFDDYYSRQRAAIQFKTPDGSLKLIPLRDYSEFTRKPLDSVRTKDNWIGAVYYNIIKTQYNGKKYYTLFGFDNHSVRSTRKWIEVLTFNERNQPVFGGPFFTFEKDSVKRPTQYRYYIEYKKEASTLVNFIPDENMILVDHLYSETDEPDKPYTYIPDGDYEGFKWQNGKWVHINKVFNFKLKDGEFPMPDPLRDDSGKNNEEKLKKQSERNIEVKKKKKNQ
ncbi:MAG: hypothetical protein ABR502_05710 [Chitinophagaceae bacterium]